MTSERDSLYPSGIDWSAPLSPELTEVWKDGMATLRNRTNRSLLWKIPLLIGIFASTLIIANFTGLNAFVVVCLLVAIIGAIESATEPSVKYHVSPDKKSASFHFYRRCNFRPIPHFFSDVRSTAAEDLSGFVTAVYLVISLPLLFPLHLLISFFRYFNSRIWLTDFKNLSNDFLTRSQMPDQGNVRGVEVLPSVQLSGGSPESGQEAPTPVTKESNSMIVIDERLELLPCGGLLVDGGISFDSNSLIDNFQLNGLALTRADKGLLRASYNGQDYAFFYNGTSWSQV